MAVEVLDLHRVAEAAEQRVAIGPDRVALAIVGHHAQIDIGVGIGRADGMGSGQVARDDPLIGLAGIAESLEESVQS
jgi:hypothetical protein